MPNSVEKRMFTRRDLLVLIWPLVIEQILNATIGLADTIMVASLGEAAMSSVSLVDSINQLIFFMLSALAAGGAIVAAQYLGKGEQEKANLAAKQLIVVTMMISLAFSVLLLLIKTPVLKLCFGAADAEVMTQAMDYFKVMAISYPFVGLYNAAAALFRAQGNSRVSMMAALVMNVINISGNALLIYGLRMGVTGAAIASTFARVVGAAFLIGLLCNANNRVHIENLWSLESLRLRPVMVGQILRVGIPNSLENLMFHAGKIILAGLIATYGTAAIAANAVTNTLMSVSQIPGSAVGFAMITVVGQCVGAKQFEEARRYMILLTSASYLLMIVSNLLIIPLLPGLIGFYNLSPESATLAMQTCICCIIGHLTCWSCSFTLPNGLRAASDVRYALGVSMVTMWLCRVALGYVLGSMLGYGVLGVWVAMVLDWLVRGILFIWRLLSGRWKNKATV